MNRAELEKTNLVKRLSRIREQVVDAKDRGEASRAAEELIGIVRSYLTWLVRGPCRPPGTPGRPCSNALHGRIG